MVKDNLKIIIREFHESALPWLVKRRLQIDLRMVRSPEVNKVITIIGPRRAGKTYFLFQIIGVLTRKDCELEDIIF